MMKKLLVIDDEAPVREALQDCFYNLYEVATAENALKGLNLLSRGRVHAVLLDLIMPRMGGIAFLEEVRELYPDLPVLIITASGNDALTREAFALGAAGLIRKPWDVPELRSLVAQAIKASESSLRDDIINKEVRRDFPSMAPVGQSSAFRRMIESARSYADENTLLVGERGVGKEFVARQMHSWSRRSKELFVTVACADLLTAFIEVEVFGKWGGTAEQSTRGAVELARNSTLFLENVHRLPAHAQRAVARLMKSGEYMRVGSQQVVPAIVRIIATLEMPLSEALAAKMIVPELAESFALSIVPVPPLRERRDDIPLLAYHFLHQFRDSMRIETSDIATNAMQKLRDYPWPGNVRELRSVIERALVLYGSSKQISPSELPQEFSGSETAARGDIDFDAAVSAYEKKLIAEAFDRTDGTVTAAAKVLEITPRKLQLRIDRLRIRLSPFKRVN